MGLITKRERSACSSRVAQDFRPGLFPGNPPVRVLLVQGPAAVQLAALRLAQWERLRVGGDAVPEIIEELQPLVERELEKLGA